MRGSDITINGKDGQFSAYLASPEGGHGPGIVVIQEIFGVNQVMRHVADALAAQGFFALVPDLFWRLEPGVQLSDKSDTEWQHAFALMNRFDPDAGIGDIQACIDHLRQMPGVTRKVGAVGYCLGGFLAYLAACRTTADAAVGYYGVNIQKKLDEAANIKAPLMLHMAGKDEYVPPAAQAEIQAGLKGNPHVTVHLYPQMNHAFARPGGAHYDQACADLANSRTYTFLKQALG